MKQFLLFCLCIVPFLSFGQVVTVNNYATKSPIGGVHIQNNKQTNTVITDSLGKANLDVFTENEVLFFSYTGFTVLVFKKHELYNSRYVVELHPTAMKLDEFVFSANKRAQSLEEVPNKLVSITQRDIRLINPQTSADLIAGSNKVFVQKSQQSGGSPMIRGFSANKVLIVVDGVRMNNAIFRGGNLQNIISIDPNMIEKTEVIFGPSSVIYGSDALGGVMDFNTEAYQYSDSSLQFNGNVGYRFSSANLEKAPHLLLQLNTKKLSSITGISYTSFGNLKMGQNGPKEYERNDYVESLNGTDYIRQNPNPETQIPSGFSSLNLSQKLGFKIRDNVVADYSLFYSTTSDNPRYDRLIERTNDGALKYAQWDYGPQVWMLNRFGLNINKPNVLFDNLNITLANQLFKESRIDRKFQSDLERNQRESVSVNSFNFDFDNAISGRSTLYYGIEFLFNKVNSEAFTKNIQDANSTLEKIQSRYPNNGTLNSYAGYLNFKVNQSKRNTFVFGLRYNHVLLRADMDTNFYKFNEVGLINQNTGALTGSIGFAFRPNNTWQINSTVSSGFKAPNIDDIAKVFDSEPGAVVIPNTKLKPEYLYNIDAIISKQFGNTLNQKIELSGYYSFLMDAMVRRNDTYNGQDSIIYDGELSQVQSIQNAASAVVTGFSVGYENRIMKNLTFQLEATYTFGVDFEGIPMRHVPPFYATISGLYSKNRLRATIYSTFNAELPHKRMAPSELAKSHIYIKDSNGNLYSPSWITLNFKADYEVNNLLLLSGGVENITNQRYRPYSSGIVAPGINFIAAATLIF